MRSKPFDSELVHRRRILESDQDATIPGLKEQIKLGSDQESPPSGNPRFGQHGQTASVRNKGTPAGLSVEFGECVSFHRQRIKANRGLKEDMSLP